MITGMIIIMLLYLYCFLSLAAEVFFSICYHEKLSVRLCQIISFGLIGWLIFLLHKIGAITLADTLRKKLRLESEQERLSRELIETVIKRKRKKENEKNRK